MRALLLTLALSANIAGAMSAPVASFDHSHARFAAILERHVRDGRVDYAALVKDRAPLTAYLRELAAVDAASLANFTRPQALAYWLNAYNAYVLETIVTHYPVRGRTLIGVAFPPGSIWQIAGAFKARRHFAGGKLRSLDEIEHEILRPEFREPRIHVALVCAARSCPPLRAEPYRADAPVDAQLADQARRFMADTEHGLHRENDGTFAISAIFKWFAEDFAALGGGDERRGVREFAARHVADPAIAAALRAADTRLKFLDYDWRLNE